MNNQDKAALVIDKNLPITERIERHAHACIIADALKEAGLLAPELPEPSLGSDGALLWNNETVWIEDDEVAVYTDIPKSFDWMTPNEARNLAHALLAAANHAEEEA